MPELNSLNPETAITYLIVSLAGLVGLLKMIAPRAFDSLLTFFKQNQDEIARKAEFDRQQHEAKLAAEQSEDVAVFSAMIALQTRTMEANQKLLDFIINDIRGELHNIAETIRCELRALNENWTRMTREIEQLKGENQLIKIELAHLVDDQNRVQQRLWDFIQVNYGDDSVSINPNGNTKTGATTTATVKRPGRTKLAPGQAAL